MKLEQQVVSLELSKKLKKLGVKQESLFSWLYIKKTKKWRLVASSELLQVRSFYVGKELVSAFTIAELGERLPKSIIVEGIEYWLQIEVQGIQDGWSCQYKNNGAVVRQVIKFFEDKTMANSGAKMLIYLKENKLI